MCPKDHGADCRVLLNGQFGDALFIAGCYWAADLIRDGHWLELWHVLRHPQGPIHWRRDLLDHGLRQLIPPALKGWLRRFRPPRPPRLPFAIHPDLVTRTGVARHPPHDPHERRYQAPGQQVRLYTLTASFWTEGFGETRGYHNRFGLEVESPYHDRRLVEYIMALPAYQLGRPWRLSAPTPSSRISPVGVPILHRYSIRDRRSAAPHVLALCELLGTQSISGADAAGIIAERLGEPATPPVP